MADVRNFGAAGDGQRDDTEAIRHAVHDGDALLEFSPGVYRLTETIEIDLAQTGFRSLVGTHGTARIIMAGSGPAFRIVGTHEGTALPSTVKPQVWDRERLPAIDGLVIEGDHPEADGIELVRTMQATLSRVSVRKVRNGITLRERNRNFLLTSSHIYDNTGIGLFFDRCNLHQAIVSANHISYNRQAGIRSIGGDLHNLQITGNDIEYNHDLDASGAAEIWFDCDDGVASEITIASNTIQAIPSPGGTNIRITGQGTAPHCSARLITISGNVLGSQTTNLEIVRAERVAVTGNTIYDGHARAILCEDSALITLDGNTFGWAIGEQRQTSDAILVQRCWGVNLTSLNMNATLAGDAESGGAISLVDCEDSAICGCLILSPSHRGITLEGCVRCRIADNSVLERHTPNRMLAAIMVRGGRGNVVQNNLVGKGLEHEIAADSDATTLQGNTIAT